MWMSKCIVDTPRKEGNGTSGELFLWQTKITSKNTLNYRSILFKITSFAISHFNLPFWKAFLCDFKRFHCGWNNRQEHFEMISDLGGKKAADSYIFLRVWSYRQVKEKQKGDFRKQPAAIALISSDVQLSATHTNSQCQHASPHLHSLVCFHHRTDYFHNSAFYICLKLQEGALRLWSIGCWRL